MTKTRSKILILLLISVFTIMGGVTCVSPPNEVNATTDVLIEDDIVGKVLTSPLDIKGIKLPPDHGVHPIHTDHIDSPEHIVDGHIDSPEHEVLHRLKNAAASHEWAILETICIFLVGLGLIVAGLFEVTHRRRRRRRDQD